MQNSKKIILTKFCLAGGYKGAIMVVMIALAIVKEVIINCYINFTNRCQRRLVMSERAVIVGKRVKAMRLQKRISQSDLAQSIGISQAHMSNIESGRSNITLENLFAIHDVLNVSMASFFVDIDNDEKQDISEEKDYIGLSDMIDALLLIKNRKISSRVLKEALEGE